VDNNRDNNEIPNDNLTEDERAFIEKYSMNQKKARKDGHTLSQPGVRASRSYKDSSSVILPFLKFSNMLFFVLISGLLIFTLISFNMMIFNYNSTFGSGKIAELLSQLGQENLFPTLGVIKKWNEHKILVNTLLLFGLLFSGYFWYLFNSIINNRLRRKS